MLERPAANGFDQLRLTRHRSWLECAAATALESASAQQVCAYWSERADELILEAWRLSGCAQQRIVVLALGKLGSRELNLSSDVDLILVRADDAEIDLKSIRKFQALLSDFTDFGFALRVDLSLRPGGKAASLVPSLSEFEYHYGYHGEPWERLAYVRMRILTGDPALSDAIRSFTQKFSYRKHLDYTLLDELKNLRTKIRQEKFETKPGCFHLKLGPGGIRELELFIHALQIIHGGRQPALRTTSTTDAILKIKELKLLPSTECDELLKSYWYLRTLENRLHAFEDQQNYLVDLVNGHPALPENFADKLRQVTSRVSAIADTFFGTGLEAPAFSGDLNDQQAWLNENGFSTASQTSTWPELLATTALSRRSERDEEARLFFLKSFAASLAESGVDRDLGLSLLLDFVKGTRAKASFFTLLNRETRVRDDLARLFSISPYLGSILASRPELIDEFIFRKQADPSSDLETLLEELAERRLLVELIASNQFLADHDLDQLFENLTSSADRICLDLLERLKIEYRAPDVSLIAMGKWGGRELGLLSDLDFVFVTQNEPKPEDHKLARRFLARMTEAHRGGSIYAVDMRLRPSGNAGPILISETSLQSYLEGRIPGSQAAAWERQAYLRARPLQNLSLSAARVSAERGIAVSDFDELKIIHQKLFHGGKPGEIDLKLTDGGLADVEFAVQIALLSRREFSIDPSTSGMMKELERFDSSWAAVGPELRDHYRYLRMIEQIYRLTSSQSGSKMRVKSDEFRRLANVLKCESEDLEVQIRSRFGTITGLLRSVRKD